MSDGKGIPGKLWTTKELAYLLGVAPVTIRAALSRKELPIEPIRMGRRVLFLDQDVRRLFELWRMRRQGPQLRRRGYLIEDCPPAWKPPKRKRWADI